MRDRDDWHLTDEIKHEAGPGDPFAAAVRATRMPMVITNPSLPDNPIVFCNEAFQALTGYTREEIVGRNCRFLQGPGTDPVTVRQIRQAIDAGHDIATDILNYRRDGSTFWNALYLSPVRNDNGDISFFFASQLDVTDRVDQQSAVEEQKAQVEREVERRTADLQAALEAKTMLLHEVDHRVKNNLTMIGSLLRLQTRTIADPAIASNLGAMLERVDALATVHRRLYQSEDIMHFDLGAFAQNLLSDILGASGRGDLHVTTDIEPVEVPSTAAAPLGLILNEMLTNAIKHAFSNGRTGTLAVSLKQRGEFFDLSVRDDGPGLAGERPAAGGLGSAVIERLAKQLNASVTWQDAMPGTIATISMRTDAE